VGAALFSRGAETYIVFDEHRAIDISALRDDPDFRSAVVTLYPAATVIRLSLPPRSSAMLAGSRSGWRIAIVSASPGQAALTPVTANDVMTFTARSPGQVVAITDPRTGGTLFVGTQRSSGQGVLIERRTPDFILPLTGQGVVVEPLSDGIGLRVTPGGFVLTDVNKPLILSTVELTGSDAELFRLLTAGHSRDAAEISRFRAEIRLARAIAADPSPSKPTGNTR
jgi:hypothetical protein